MLAHLIIPNLLAFTFAIPTPNAPTTNDALPSTERWTIPRLNLHFMNGDTGIPGNQWPPELHFETTMSFDVFIPHSQETTTCTAAWPNGTFPTELFKCSTSPNQKTAFALSPYTGLGERKPELSFTLAVVNVVYTGPEDTGEAIYTGKVYVTANEPGVPTSYLTCLNGRPFDGMRCGLKGMMSVSGELGIDVVRNDIGAGYDG
ncbi:hypothetical protein EK21DRAFT_106446 [Setomelanomma holmii]|uniref:Ubiquitin 3 binding protein But2 C-terminal domain-containing protein n=1 Tax=Setomelanomma holmii TaxID=210430 RepID=A0A9P4LV39_9PLEO|nr:hypothetical protein EK21DRAFT_106446 [Setomelanomma holmii]